MLRRFALIGGSIVCISILGVVMALWLDGRRDSATPSSTPTIRLQAATLGTVASKTEIGKSNPKIKQQGYYYTSDPLVLRLTTDTSVKQPFTISARLLRDGGDSVMLAPAEATFSPGTSTFCCWYAPQAGEYTFQIFYDRRVLTSIPLLIQAGEAPPTSAL